MHAIECKKREGAFILIMCLFLWVGTDVNSVSGWEIYSLQAKLQEQGARWTAGETSLSHLTPEEFKQMLGLKIQKQIKAVSPTSRPSRIAIPYAVPSSIDWRDNDGENWVTPIKNQQQCGSCYSFATLGTMETLIKLDQGDPDFVVDLSEQYLVSCGPYGNYGGYDYGGCIGNYTYYVADFLMSTGVPDESCFPYDVNQIEGTEPSCDNVCADVASRVEKITGWAYIAPHATNYLPNPDQIKAVLVDKPVPCGMFTYEDLQYYTGGVYEPLPDQESLGGHLVHIIGYDDSQSCWIVKNSWGTNWGESGFFRIAYSETSESSLTMFGLEALDLDYGEQVTTSTTTTTSVSTTTTVLDTTTTTTTIELDDMPNLMPCTPPGWSHPIVPSSQQGTSTHNPGIDVLYPSPQKTYIDFALCNENNGDATDSFTVVFYIDGVEVFTAEVEDVLEGKSCKSWADKQFSLSEGEHTLKIVVDIYNEVVEADENDNFQEMTFTWEAALWPGLYREMFGDNFAEEVILLRDFRDEILIADRKWRPYVDILYKNSFEIASLLLKDEDLRMHTAVVIKQLLPELVFLLNNKEAMMSSRMISSIDTLLDEFEAKASPGVDITIKGVKKEFRKGEALNQFGIKVE